jgi:glutathione S-transferase
MDSSVGNWQLGRMDQFYFIPFGCSLAAQGLLHELGHPHEAVQVRPGADGLGDATFGALSPGRTVPVLAAAAGVFTQSSQILLHLAAAHPEAGLLPGKEEARRDTLNWLGYVTSDVHPSFRTLLNPQHFLQHEAGLSELRERSAQKLARQLQVLEQRLASLPYLSGEHFGVVDPYALVFSFWCAHLSLPYPPRLGALARRVAERPGYQRAIALEQAAMAAH